MNSKGEIGYNPNNTRKSEAKYFLATLWPYLMAFSTKHCKNRRFWPFSINVLFIVTLSKFTLINKQIRKHSWNGNAHWFFHLSFCRCGFPAERWQNSSVSGRCVCFWRWKMSSMVFRLKNLFASLMTRRPKLVITWLCLAESRISEECSNGLEMDLDWEWKEISLDSIAITCLESMKKVSSNVQPSIKLAKTRSKIWYDGRCH